VRLWNRTAEKASSLACALGVETAPSLPEAVAWADVVIYTLPGSVPIPSGLLSLEGKVVLEAEYRSPQLSHAPCLRYLSGRRWLLYQAVAGYSLFTGEIPQVEEMEKVL
jgi:shikimate 5-dehydrogenase